MNANEESAGPTILVPLDGSEFAEASIAPAASLTRGADGRLLLMCVPEVYGIDMAWYADAAEPGSSVAVPIRELLSEARETTEAYLRQKADELAGEGIAVQTDIEEKEPGVAIVETAEAWDVWIIAMSTHGHGGVTRWAFGSVADYVLHHGLRPILLVRAQREHAGFRHLMVALDGSERAEAILPDVERLAVATGARASLVCVVKEAPAAGLRPSVLEARQRHVNEMQTYVEEQAAALQAAGVSADTDVLTGRSTAEALLSWEAENDVDLVALTTHGRSGLRRAAFGSVADRLIREGAAPVLVRRVQ